MVLTLLLSAYTFNFIDRTIVATIGQAIKVDLKLTDTQLGLLNGLSFAILYTILGVPIARLAERFNRVSIISLAMVVWSGFTMACGLAGSFATLLLLRVGVGVGEAGCSPPAHSLISDYFEPKRRASALSVYALGIPIGAMIGAALGGFLAKTFGWRIAFMVVGAPGVIAALVIKLIVREPPRGHSDDSASKVAVQSELRELWAVTRTLFGRWPALNIMLGVTLVSFAGYGVGAFAPPYFNRAFGLDYATVGLIFGLIGGGSAALGTIIGGVVSDRLARRGARWYALTPAIGVALSLPISIAAYSQDTGRRRRSSLFLPGLFSYNLPRPNFGLVQNSVEPHQRATATAVMFLFLNLIALAAGPCSPAGSSTASPTPPSRAAATSLAQSVASLFAGAPGVSFKHACPGGLAPKGSTPAVALTCRSVLAASTRQGILVTFFFAGWGAFHYLLASFGVHRMLRAPEPSAIATA